ncbi:MAG: hypothetical protein U9R69_12280 [Thermodesulfobacteriota bacterium]|nr:hypothetical protein [Thermodesulfobacteriota bacterium]
MIGIIFAPVLSVANTLDEVSLQGSLKSFNLYIENFPYADQDGVLSSDRIRLDLTGQLTQRFDFEFSLDQQLLWTSRTGVVGLAANSVNRRLDLQKNWHEGERFSGQLQVDRLNIHGELSGFHWTFGRQTIGFGRISLFSPLDIIAPFPPDAIDVDVRPGVDAIRIAHYFGMAGQIGGIAVFGAEKKDNSYLLTLGENVKSVDFLAIGGHLRGRSMVGVGLAGEFGKVGLKAELSWYQGRDVDHPQGDLYDDFGIAAVEGWYRFDNGLVLLGEYLFNGVGSDNPNEYPLVATSAPITEGLSFLLARHYLLLVPSYQFHPLVTANGLLIYNIEDHSSLIRPQLVISLADNLQLDLFWAITTGQKSHLDPLTQLTVIRSEFGSTGDSGGLLLRWYF